MNASPSTAASCRGSRRSIKARRYRRKSYPIDKTGGDRVFAGTLNQFGAIVVAAEKVGAATTFGQVVQLVGAAAARKAPLERTADRLARYFLPVVLALAAATLFGYASKWVRGRGLAAVLGAGRRLPVSARSGDALRGDGRNGLAGPLGNCDQRVDRPSGWPRSIKLRSTKPARSRMGRLQIGDVQPAGSPDETELLRLAAAAEKSSVYCWLVRS